MAYNEFKPQMWEDTILDNLDSATVFKNLCNTSYKGLISGKGSSIIFEEVGDVETKEYDGSVTYEDLDTASKTLVIDQEYYTAVSIGSVDAVQANQNLMSIATKRMGVSMAQNEDLHIAAKYGDAGIVIGGTGDIQSITSSNVLEFFTDVALKMDENNVPQEGRVAVVPAWVYQKLVLAGILTDTDNSLLLNNGKIGERLGFSVYKSNNVSHSGTSWYAPMFFVEGMTIGFADQLTETDAGKHESKFGDYVRTLNVYGSKVLYPDTLCAAYIASGSEV